MIIGHQRIIKFLSGSIKTNHLAHAYLFVGPPQVGKKTIALEFIKALQCQNKKIKNGDFAACDQCQDCLLINKGRHPDVLVIEPGYHDENEDVGKTKKTQEIKIEQIRGLQHHLSLTPFSAPQKVIIIDSAENLTQEAANCLLKTLEEPPPKSLLILVSSNFRRLLPTIISRCQLIKFLPVPAKLIEQGLLQSGFRNKQKISQAVKIAGGRPGLAQELLKNPESLIRKNQAQEEFEKIIKQDLVGRFKYVQVLAQDTTGARQILDDWIIWFRNQLLAGTGNDSLIVFDGKPRQFNYSLSKISQNIKNIQEAQTLLSESSFNARLVLENLMLKI